MSNFDVAIEQKDGVTTYVVRLPALNAMPQEPVRIPMMRGNSGEGLTINQLIRVATRHAAQESEANDNA